MSDAQVPAQYLQLQNDFFAFGAESMAKAMTRSDEKSYLYYFTYAETGKRSKLGAYHGEELFFWSNSFPADWQHTPDDQTLSKEMQVYWVQFAKTGDPNTPSLPKCPAYSSSARECFELGRTVGVRPMAPKLAVLARIMKEIFADTLEPTVAAGKK